MSIPARWRGPRPRRKRSSPLLHEDLENRVVLSVLIPIQWHDPNPLPPDTTHAHPSSGSKPLDFGSPTPVGYTPAQIRAAYGIDNVVFGSITGDGTGQTIAIVDAYDDPAFLDSNDPNFSSSDLAQFDQAFGLPNPPSFTKYNESGQTTNLPGTDPAGAGNLSGNWEMEEALDIEWAHAIAPGASIDLVEASNDTNNADLFKAVQTAASLPGVSVVSMSWGTPEYSGEQAIDSTFTTPAGHQGVTFIAASGDQGSPGYYPAYSPNVLAAGGTTLILSANNTIQSETAWSGSGGGTSQYEPAPAYQQGFQSTKQRTVPDVAWDADPNTGVAMFDSYDNTDNSGDWYEIGGTSVAAPSWSGLIAIANQGRAIEKAGSLDGPTQTLPAIYYAPSSDFNDITKGSNGGFSAGPGYDEVTGRGTPIAPALVPDLLSFGAASQIAVTAQPPAQVIANDQFGVVVSAEDPAGQVDPSFSGSVTIALANNPTGAKLNGTLTVTASHGVAVFDDLSISQLGTGYTFKISTGKFSSVTTTPFAIIANPTPNSGTFYPVPTDASLRNAIATADSNGYASNTIVLSATTYVLTNTTAGQIVIQNTSGLSNKTLTIAGQGDAAGGTIIQPGTSPWQDRDFEVLGTTGSKISVVFQDLAIAGGDATGGGVLGGKAALGGGLLIDGGTVEMTKVAVRNNQAKGADGATGAAGGKGQAPGAGGDGQIGRGGGIYLANGTLILKDSTFSHNVARGGAGGSGGAAAQIAGATKISAGAKGGTGASASGGGLYVAGGTVQGSGDSFASNAAIGGQGGLGGKGGLGGVAGGGGAGGPGGAGASAFGGGIYLHQGAVTLGASQFQGNTAVGGAGGKGGTGGPGSSLVATTSNLSLTGISQTPSGGTHLPTGTSILNGTSLSKLFHGGPGGNGGAGGPGGAASGGGVYVGGGSLTVSDTTLGGNQAIGGQGGTGGKGGQAGMAALLVGIGGGGGTSLTGGGGTSTKPAPLGGSGGLGGDGGAGSGGGLFLAAGTVTFIDDTASGNAAHGGDGGAGGTGGAGGFAGGLSGIGGIGTHTGGTTGAGAGLSLGGSRTHAKHQTSGGGSTNIGGFATGGIGGDGGGGGLARGGAFYVAGGSLTLGQDTVATNSVLGGHGGSGGPGGKGGSYGLGNGPAGSSGSAGIGSAGAAYVNGGTVSLDNSTVALNTQSGGGSVGGVLQAAGTVNAVSTLFAGNGPIDYAGGLNATDCLIQALPKGDAIAGTGNLIGVNPLLAAAGLANNGGPTQTIALQTGSPAIGKGTDPENFLIDQRGYGPRTGAGGTDIGAVQHDAIADTTPPTAALVAAGVTSTSAPDPYTFTVTYADNIGIAVSSLAGAVVQVTPPGGGPITAGVASTKAVGLTDPSGNAKSFVVTYEITPPGGTWSATDDGTYTVTLGGTPVTDLSGNAVKTGSLGSFVVNIPATVVHMVITAQPPGSVTAGASFTVTVAMENSQGQVQTGYIGSVTIALASNPGGSTLGGTLTVNTVNGVATLSGLTLNKVGTGYTLQVSSSGLTAVTTTAFNVTPAAAVSFLKTDTTTQGSWIGTYGAQAYDLINGPSSLPATVTVTPSGQKSYTWAASTTDPRALQVPGSSNRLAACWYSSTSFTVDVNITDGQTHDLELYFLDWDSAARAESVQISDAVTGAVLNNQAISSFHNGLYLDYAVSGNILITITRTAGVNAVLSGLFLDPTISTASFLKTDTTTQGSWIGTYGAQAYDLINGPSSLPSTVTVTPSGQKSYTWAASTTDPRALQIPGSSNRLAACWYSSTSFTVDVNITDGQTHDLELYFVDWDSTGRSEQVQISNAATGAVLSTQTISSFHNGLYLDYSVSGNILITITRTGGLNAVLSGLFLDPTSTSGAATLPTTGGPVGGAIPGSSGNPSATQITALDVTPATSQIPPTVDKSSHHGRPKLAHNRPKLGHHAVGSTSSRMTHPAGRHSKATTYQSHAAILIHLDIRSHPLAHRKLT